MTRKEGRKDSKSKWGEKEGRTTEGMNEEKL